ARSALRVDESELEQREHQRGGAVGLPEDQRLSALVRARSGREARAIARHERARGWTVLQLRCDAAVLDALGWRREVRTTDNRPRMSSILSALLSVLSLAWVLVVISPQTYRPLMLLLGVWAIIR